jgi:hypothetical protein
MTIAITATNIVREYSQPIGIFSMFKRRVIIVAITIAMKNSFTVGDIGDLILS